MAKISKDWSAVTTADGKGVSVMETTHYHGVETCVGVRDGMLEINVYAPCVDDPVAQLKIPMSLLTGAKS